MNTHKDKGEELKTVLSDEEWLKEDLSKFKLAYKSPDKLADEMIRLIKRVRDDKEFSDDRKWLMFGAIENAWHIMLWSQNQQDRVARFFNTVRVYIGGSAL